MEGSHGVASASPALEPSRPPTVPAGRAPLIRDHPAAEAPGDVCLLCCLVVQSLSGVRLFETPWTAAHQASLSFTISWTLLRLVSIELVCLLLSFNSSLYTKSRLLPVCPQ